jgi:DNA (cytosine-5)-methyltransferase 1
MTLKILNLYAGIGGNRKLWTGDIEVTAVENVPEIAKIYQDFFPNDKVIVTDAHQYLLEHYKEFDFIWSSPPCPTHSITNHFLNAQGVIRYPDMSLWQEIILLKTFYYGIFVVENVVSYYEPLIKPQAAGRHYFWANFRIDGIRIEKAPFNIANMRASTRKDGKDNLKSLELFHGISLEKYNDKKIDKRKLLRNCVRPELGKQIFQMAFKNKQEVLKI